MEQGHQILQVRGQSTEDRGIAGFQNSARRIAAAA
jgi:hypothetical protein